MSHKLPNYLKRHRKKAGLKQHQVAYLLGSRSGAKVSRFEHGHRLPDARTLFALETIYHAPARDLFAGVYKDIKRDTERRARRLEERLKRPQSQKPTNAHS